MSQRKRKGSEPDSISANPQMAEYLAKLLASGAIHKSTQA